MVFSKFTYFLSVFLFILITNTDCVADQSDPRLNDLFARLSLSIENSNEKVQIENKIWTIWMMHEDPNAQRLLRQGTAEMTIGNLTAAEISFTKLIELVPEFAEVWNKRATLRYIQNQYEKSISDIRQTLLLEPRHFGAIAGLGLNFEALGQRDAAISAYTEALVVNPHMTQIREKLRALNQSVLEEQI